MAARFDRVARPYRLLEFLTFGRALTRTRLHFLADLSHCRNALVLGDGDGRFLAALLRSNPHLHAAAVDTSAVMLSLLQTGCASAADRLSVHRCDALAFAHALAVSAPPFDLVVTHFFLDCFTDRELAALVPAIRQHLAPGALWVLSDFRIPPAGPLRLPAKVLVRTLYLAFWLLTGLRVTRLPSFRSSLSASGLKRRATHLFLRGLLTAELWDLPSAAAPSAASTQSR